MDNMEKTLPTVGTDRIKRNATNLMSLTNKRSYSPKEHALFQLLPQNGKPVTTTELLEKFYKGRRIPVSGRSAINVFLKRLQAKVEYNREPFQVCVSTMKCHYKPFGWQIVRCPRL